MDGSVWGTVAFRYPGAKLRFDPRTRLSEIYNVPPPGFGVRGGDIDRNGVVWVSLASGHAAAGWKGRGLWMTSGDRTPWHKEGGKGTKPLVVHFQVRPSPLAD